MTIRLFEYDAQMVLVGLESPTWNFGTKIPCFILILISPMPRKERVHLRLTVCHQGNGRIWRLPGMWTMALDVGAGQKVCSIWYSIPKSYSIRKKGIKKVFHPGIGHLACRGIVLPTPG